MTDLNLTRETYRGLVPAAQPPLVRPAAHDLSDQRVVDAARDNLNKALGNYWIEHRTLPTAAAHAELRNAAWVDAVRVVCGHE